MSHDGVRTILKWAYSHSYIHGNIFTKPVGICVENGLTISCLRAT